MQSETLEPSSFSPSDQSTLLEMIGAYFGKERNAFSSISDGAERARSVLGYVFKEGRLPKPPIAMEATGGLTFVDGNHRVAAWTAYSALYQSGKLDEIAATPVPRQNVWVGRHKSGELFR